MTWDVRTNIKAKPGSQGTLFQGGSDQMTDAKWPRGYTPERLHEVLPAIAPSKVWVADEPMMPQAFDTASERRKLVDNVARSTVPAHHLLGVQFSPGSFGIDVGLPGGDMAAGTYSRQQGATLPQIQIAREYSGASVPIHEIGHHVSATQQTEHSDYSNTRQRGQEEAFADNYAQQHYRPRRGERYHGVGMYNGGEIDHVRNQEFFDAYHAHRDYRPVFGATSMGVGATKSPTPRPPGAPNPNPPLPGLEAYGFNTPGGNRRSH